MKGRYRKLAALICCSPVLIAQATLRAQPPASDTNNRYQSNSLCIKCHSAGLTEAEIAKGIGNRVCLTESTFWEKADHHPDAYARLSGPRGKQIGELLRATAGEPRTGCVQCHTSSVDAPELVKEGVSCEGCHGPSSNWLGKHVAFPDWQNTSAADKARSGWYDVRSPIKRAELCASCHVGSPEHNRVITHAMYAAGHPPLSGFELESFADQMPRHWRYSYEKQKDAKASFDRTRNLLVAAVVTMRMAVELAVADAEATQFERWPELARLDCFACHHELRSPSWRQVSFQAGNPGRTKLVSGCLPLVEVAASTAGGTSEEDLKGIVERLRLPFVANPFGDPAELATQGKAAIGWCRSIEERLQSLDFTPKHAHDALRRLADQAIAQQGDYDTARQVLGAWMVICRELVANGELTWPADKRQRVGELLNAINQEYAGLVTRGQIRIGCTAVPPAKRDFDQVSRQQIDNRIDFEPQRFVELMSTLEPLVRE